MPLTIYEAIDHGTDGRDSKTIGFYETKSLAENAAKGRGASGHGNGTVTPILVTTEDDVRRAAEQEKMAAHAKKKLTVAELRALELHFERKKK